MSSDSARPACHKAHKKPSPGPAQKCVWMVLGSRNAPWAGPSNGSRSGAHKELLQKIYEEESICDPASFALIALVWIARRQWYQRSNLFPKRIGDFKTEFWAYHLQAKRLLLKISLFFLLFFPFLFRWVWFWVFFEGGRGGIFQ